MIPLQPIPKKNSQQILYNKRTHRPFISQSESYKAYEHASMYYIKAPDKPIDSPVNVKMVFFRKDKHRVDLVNLEEAILDILVRSGVLTDDCFSVVRSMDGSRVEVDKEYPRTEITITEVNYELIRTE